MKDFMTPGFSLTDPNEEFRRLVRSSGRKRSEIARLLERAPATINAYMTTRASKKWRRVDPALVKTLRHILHRQEEAADKVLTGKGE